MLKIRLVNINDCDYLYEWINDPVTREASFISNKISYEEHRSWFDRSLKDPKRTIYIAEDKNKVCVGAVRLDNINENVVEFDINIAPAMRGKGYGVKLLEMACNRYPKKANKIMYLARIKKANIPSIKTFVKAGFFELFNYQDRKHGPVNVLGRIS